jgi:outer membrane protein assembly factor BamD (BamD/ComL family)
MRLRQFFLINADSGSRQRNQGFRFFTSGILAGCLSMGFLSGCVSPWEKSALLHDPTPNIDRVQGPTERSLRNVFHTAQDDPTSVVDGKSLKPIPGTEQYLAATDIYKDGHYKEAERAFHKISKAKKFKKSEIREDALFMEAEAAWKQEHFANAHDVYAKLLREYPSTRHLTIVSERMFDLGRRWLEFPEVAKLGEVQQVNLENPARKLPSEEPPQLPNSRPIYVMNWTNPKEPLFDTAGNGIACLSSVWMNDPSGPLADDAMMLVASHYARKGNYVEADRHYAMLRETFPSSPHVQNAFLIGSHVKLMSFQGPEYEARTLEDAQKLKEATLNLYPNLPDADRDRLRKELELIENQKALAIWTTARFYADKKGNKRAGAIACHQVITQYPKSPYAKEARAKLVEMGPEYASGSVFEIPYDKKKTTLINLLLPDEPTFRLRRYPLIGTARDPSKPEASKPAPVKEQKDTKKRDTKTDKKPAETDKTDDQPDETPPDSKLPKSKKSQGATPRPLPEEEDWQSGPYEASRPGRAKL